MSVTDELHQQLFGFTPAKPGTAYERLSALVFAVLGWQDVVHDKIEQPEGRRAGHQLDVTARHPDGVVTRLLIECKDWEKTVGKATLDALVGKRDQIGADAAAAVTTSGFTRGARMVAVDEDIALIRLRPYRAVDDARFVKRVVINFDLVFPEVRNLQLTFSDRDELPVGASVQIGIGTGQRLRHRDGTDAETVDEVLAANSSPRREGTFSCSAELPEGRLLTAVDGRPVPITGLTWTEVNVRAHEELVIDHQGAPCLVLEQLDELGDPFSARVVVDRDLYRWDIAADGSVAPRGDLLPRPRGNGG